MYLYNRPIKLTTFIPPLNVIKQGAQLVEASALQADIQSFSVIIGSGQNVKMSIWKSHFDRWLYLKRQRQLLSKYKLIKFAFIAFYSQSHLIGQWSPVHYIHTIQSLFLV